MPYVEMSWTHGDALRAVLEAGQAGMDHAVRECRGMPGVSRDLVELIAQMAAITAADHFYNNFMMKAVPQSDGGES